MCSVFLTRPAYLLLTRSSDFIVYTPYFTSGTLFLSQWSFIDLFRHEADHFVFVVVCFLLLTTPVVRSARFRQDLAICTISFGGW